MATFDPAAATAAYLATLPPAAHARATAYTHGGHWLLLWDWLVTIAVAFIIVRSRLLARAEERVERKRPRPVLASAVAAAVFLALDFVLQLPWDVYAQWWREKQYGLTSQPLPGWLGEQVISFVISLVLTVLFLAAMYALIRRAPRTWWAWAGGLAIIAIVFMAVAAPIFIEPLFNTYTPAPNGPVRDAVTALAHKAGVPSDKIYIYNGSRQSNRYTANVSGLGRSARVALSDTMFAKGADIGEVRAVVGHEMGHYSHKHLLWTALVSSLLAVAAFWLTDLLFPYVANLMGADVGGIADPAGLPVVVAIIATLSLLATPLLNTETRLEEADADSFSLRYANEPDGLARAMVKTIEYRASSPTALEEFIFYDHPSVEHRVRKAMEWKAAHMGGDRAQHGSAP
ncbi:MAG: M48 family metallopeptidase [Caulobacteraceae bacterium]